MGGDRAPSPLSHQQAASTVLRGSGDPLRHRGLRASEGRHTSFFFPLRFRDTRGDRWSKLDDVEISSSLASFCQCDEER